MFRDRLEGLNNIKSPMAYPAEAVLLVSPRSNGLWPKRTMAAALPLRRGGNHRSQHRGAPGSPAQLRAPRVFHGRRLSAVIPAKGEPASKWMVPIESNLAVILPF